MDFKNIRAQLQTSLLKEGNVQQLYQEFCQKTDSDDLEFFLETLHFQGWIDDQHYQRFTEQIGISLTEVPTLTFYGRSKTVSGADQLNQTVAQSTYTIANQAGQGTGILANSSQTRAQSSGTHDLKWNSPEVLEQYLEENFTFIDQIGEGAMGKIHLVKENNLQRKIAFKTLHESIAGDEVLLKRFLNEVQITAQLDHPNIVPIYGLVHTESGIAYSMKLIKGKTLKDLLETARACYENKKPLTEHVKLIQLLEHFLKLCDAVEFAHSKRVIHRDLKPENVMIGPYNEVYLMDWGIAKVIAPESEEEKERLVDKSRLLNTSDITMNMTSFDDLLGTPSYMSPEQITATPEELEFTSDIYSLGIILYEMICLKSPYNAKKIGDLLEMVITGDRLPVEHFSSAEKIPHELKAIIDKATSHDSIDRYQQVSELADDIRRFLRGEEVLAQPDNHFQKLLRGISKHRQLTLMIMMGIFMVSSLLVSWSFYARYSASHKAQIREHNLTRFLNVASDKSQFINSKFMSFEALIEGFANSMEQLIENGTEKPSTYYASVDYLNGPFPKDLKFSSVYDMPISIESPVFRIFPGVERKSIEPLIYKMTNFNHYLQRLLLASHSKEALSFNRGKAEDLIRNQGVLAIVVYVGFEEGFGFIYPGRMKYNPDYDSRKRPWYTLTRNSRGIQWGQPYVDSAGLGWVVACTKALYDSKQRFRGVVGLDMLLKVITQLIEISELSSVKDVYLLDSMGNTLVKSSEKKKTYEAGTLINKNSQLELFKNKKVVEAIKQKLPSGYVQDPATRRIYSYNLLNSTGWYYVAEADSQTLFSKN